MYLGARSFSDRALAWHTQSPGFNHQPWGGRGRKPFFTWLQTEKRQKCCCDRDRSHYTISLAVFGSPFFPVILKRSKSQGLDIRQLVLVMPIQLFILFVHDCYPSQTEMQSNLKALILCNSVVFIPAYSFVEEFQWNSNSRLIFPAIYFLRKRKFPQRMQQHL